MKEKKRIILIIICIVLSVIYVISAFFMGNDSSKYLLELNTEYNNIIINDNADSYINYKEIIDELKMKYNNDDIVGVLKINNTDYIVPILQGEDNDYYLNHTPDGKKNFMGSIFLDYRVDIDSSKKLLIYGHNSSNIDMPFKILENFYDKDYYNDHKYVEITTITEKKKYEIFSVYVETEDFSYMDINFDNDEEYLNHLKKLKSKSLYDTGVEVTVTDEILILQTCSEHENYKKYSKKYLLIIFKKV